MSRLQELYKSTLAANLRDKFGYTNPMQTPKLQKVVINMGVGREVTANPKAIEAAAQDLLKITGQKPVIRKAKKAIANFKLREGLPIGVSVTLRNKQMYEFVDRLINIALPRVRDFRGVSRTAFDGRGNYSLGLPEQIIFPEIDLEKSTVRGLNVTFVTSAKTDEEAFVLLQIMGMPYRKKAEITVDKATVGSVADDAVLEQASA